MASSVLCSGQKEPHAGTLRLSFLNGRVKHIILGICKKAPSPPHQPLIMLPNWFCARYHPFHVSSCFFKGGHVLIISFMVMKNVCFASQWEIDKREELTLQEPTLVRKVFRVRINKVFIRRSPASFSLGRVKPWMKTWCRGQKANPLISSSFSSGLNQILGGKSSFIHTHTQARDMKTLQGFNITRVFCRSVGLLKNSWVKLKIVERGLFHALCWAGPP